MTEGTPGRSSQFFVETIRLQGRTSREVVRAVKSTLDRMDHVAIQVQDIESAVEWYRQRFSCEVEYKDQSWAMIQFANIKLALVLPSQHPGHLGFVSSRAAEFGELRQHRDGSRSTYLNDPAGNSIELLDAG